MSDNNELNSIMSQNRNNRNTKLSSSKKAMPKSDCAMIMKNGGSTHTMPDGTVHQGATHSEYLKMLENKSSGY
tara:strand:- start:108949 stop:109167 length:219 start_codon:yes stop_codon:yes gene_type:complete